MHRVELEEKTFMCGENIGIWREAMVTNLNVLTRHSESQCEGKPRLNLSHVRQ
jgi:hypothetical protein